jgi:hypothetical protein
MLDFMWKNLWVTLVEGIRILIWLLRKIPVVFDWIATIVVVLAAWSTIHRMVIVSGWKKVNETLIERWIKYDYEENTLTMDQEKGRRSWYVWKAHLFIVLGFVINTFIILVMIYSTMRLTGYELLISR